LLALAELEAAAGSALAVFLSFHHTGIAGKKAVAPQGNHIGLVDLAECAGKAVTAGARLTVGAAAVNIDQHVKFVFAGSNHEGLANYHGVFPLGKISAQFLAVDNNFTGAIPYIDPRDSGFSSAGSNS
jgi:hypothetical protein